MTPRAETSSPWATSRPASGSPAEHGHPEALALLLLQPWLCASNPSASSEMGEGVPGVVRGWQRGAGRAGGAGRAVAAASLGFHPLPSGFSILGTAAAQATSFVTGPC